MHLGSYDNGYRSVDGGVAEIIVFNPINRMMYVVNEQELSIDMVYLGHLQSGEMHTFSLTNRINIGLMGNLHGFEVADVTSVTVIPRLGAIAASIQSYHWMDQGTIVFMDFDGNYVTHVSAGVQPDMITTSPDGLFVMTAAEAEPRLAFTDGNTFGTQFGPGAHNINHLYPDNSAWNFDYDPVGGVTVVDLRGINHVSELATLSEAQVNHVGFEDWDTPARMDELRANEVIWKAGNLPSRDFEPEYIVFSADGQTAFVALQENNAIAHFDMASQSFTRIEGIGFIDHSLPGNEINLSMAHINITNEVNVFGMPQPDGIAAIEINGVQYILTANEGDAREWDFYAPGLSGAANRARYHNFRRSVVNGSPAVENIVNEMHYVLNERTADWFLFGSRSFSIIRANDNEMVFDSGSDFERIVAETFPTIFNAHHRDNVFGVRSSRKGPEPESVVAMGIDGRYFAFISLERAGGLMMYEISDTSNPIFIDYLNIRDPQINGVDAGDLGAEGLYAITAANSPTGTPLVLVANEVSGAVTVMEVVLSDGADDGTEELEAARAELQAVIDFVHETLDAADFTPESWQALQD
ncbi:MAG: choice-of-anchor I family protein [Turicibacter sp.]|nr:choice-of-anchor I family protein [Turicibacter sp.]